MSKFEERAREILREYCELEHQHDWDDVVRNRVHNANGLVKLIVAALEAVEKEAREAFLVKVDAYDFGYQKGQADALKARIVGPDLNQMKKLAFEKSRDWPLDEEMDVFQLFWEGMEAYRDNLKLAPPEASVDITTETGSCNYPRIVGPSVAIEKIAFEKFFNEPIFVTGDGITEKDKAGMAWRAAIEFYRDNLKLAPVQMPSGNECGLAAEEYRIQYGENARQHFLAGLNCHCDNLKLVPPDVTEHAESVTSPTLCNDTPELPWPTFDEFYGQCPKLGEVRMREVYDWLRERMGSK